MERSWRLPIARHARNEERSTLPQRLDHEALALRIGAAKRIKKDKPKSRSFMDLKRFNERFRDLA